MYLFESGYYPPGAEFDPRAPYNEEPSAEDVCGDKVEEKMNEEIANFDDRFEDFVYDECPDMIEPKDWYNSLSSDKQKEIVDAYFDEYYEDDCIEMAQEEAERNDWAREYAMELKNERD